MLLLRELTVQTDCGLIKGMEENGALAWKGIPYAQPPVRFSAPQPVEKWSGVRDGTRFGPSCPQENEKRAPMAEDCLYLNIWSPDTEGARPVMFFIHGGSFAGGSASEPAYNGANLAQKEDVVVVTVNYRVGILGFLDFSFLDEAFRPNCGLLDILEALRWVGRNAKTFGGDPGNITVFGQSAGGTLTSVLPTLPAAEGLFSKIIVMSGGPTLLQGKEEGQRTARAFLALSGIEGADGLRHIPAEALPELQRSFVAQYGLGAGTFRISVDEDVVPDYPIPGVKNRTVRIPMLIGTTREEMSFLLIKPVAKALDVDGIMQAGVGHETPECVERIPRVYERLYGKKRGQALMFSDMVFRMGNVWYVQEYSRQCDVWMYRFDYETAAMRVSGLHSFHSSDIPFVFGNFREGMGKLMFLFSPSLKRARRLSREIQHDFAEFARTGRAKWEKCGEGRIPAKCYNSKCGVYPAVEAEIVRQYEGTHFQKTSFSSCREN